MILHARLADYAIPLIGTERDDEAENIILSLAAFTDVKLDECMRSMDSQSCFWPSLPFQPRTGRRAGQTLGVRGVRRGQP